VRPSKKTKKQNELLTFIYEKNAKTFCRAILGLKVGRRKALANLLMALTSNTGSRSVTELSESYVYYYQYSSIRKDEKNNLPV